MNWLGRVVPGTKFRLDANGSSEPDGHRVAKPAPTGLVELSTVALPTKACAAAGIVMSPMATRPGSTSGVFAVNGAPGATCAA